MMDCKDSGIDLLDTEIGFAEIVVDNFRRLSIGDGVEVSHIDYCCKLIENVYKLTPIPKELRSMFPYWMPINQIIATVERFRNLLQNWNIEQAELMAEKQGGFSRNKFV